MKPIALLVVASTIAVGAIGVEITMKFGWRGLAHAGGLAAAVLLLVAAATAYLDDYPPRP